MPRCSQKEGVVLPRKWEFGPDNRMFLPRGWYLFQMIFAQKVGVIAQKERVCVLIILCVHKPRSYQIGNNSRFLGNYSHFLGKNNLEKVPPSGQNHPVVWAKLPLYGQNNYHFLAILRHYIFHYFVNNKQLKENLKTKYM